MTKPTLERAARAAVTWLWKLTDGRPMKRDGLAFVDQVSGKSVEYRTDKFGRQFMTDGGAWGLFRVPLVKKAILNDREGES